jgi:hypothetical protein
MLTEGDAASFRALSGSNQIRYAADGMLQPNAVDLPSYAGTATGDTVRVMSGAFLIHRFST